MAIAFSLTACGSNDDNSATAPSGNGAVSDSGTAKFTATIDGVPFTALVPYFVYVPASGTLSLTGTDESRGITVGASSLAEAGTYPFQTSTLPALNADVSNRVDTQLQHWNTLASGASGTITFTALSTSHVAGSFSFTGVAASGTTATGMKTVTEGLFDLTNP